VSGDAGASVWAELACVTEVVVMAIPGATWLVRVGVADGADLDAARLVDLRSDEQYVPLPGIAGGASTLGFAVPAGTRTADVQLDLGGRCVPLPTTPARRFARPQTSAPLDAQLDALELRTQLSRAERRAVELHIELRRRDAAVEKLRRECADTRAGAERWRARYRELRRDAALLVLSTKTADPPSPAPERPGSGWRVRSIVVAGVAMSLAAAAVGATVGRGDRSPAAVAPVQAAGTPAAAARIGDIPARWVRLYKRAGARYGLDWTMLAAVGSIESGHGDRKLVGVRSGSTASGAAGPAQFLADTWQRYGVDGDGDGVADPHDAADATFAMAAYLRASGAPQNWGRALWAYNRSDAYVRRVLQQAGVYRRLSRGA